MSWVDVENFTYSYPGEQNPALKDINLQIPMGAFVVITGNSGSGKSTLGKALAGFLFQDESPDYSGKIIVNDQDMSLLPLYQASERVAYVQQNPEDQFCTLTVLDEIAFGLENKKIEPEKINQKIDEVLEIVNGLDLRDRELTTLSGGEKQKVAIASMLALSPDVLILDEPTSNLDPISTQNVFETLYYIIQNQALTVIIIEHKLAQLKAFEAEMYSMEAGKLQPYQPESTFPPQMTSKEKKFSNFQQDRPVFRNSLINLTNIEISRNNQIILRKINLQIEPGEFVALMGPNGSGKTTLLKTIIGFHKAQSGSIKVLDYENERIKTSALVPNLGFIFQNPDHQLFTQSVWDEAIFTSKNLGIFSERRQQKAQLWLEQIGLGERIQDHPQRLSYGEKRRLNLVAAMLHEPQILLIDELLIGQDMANATHWLSLLKEFTEIGNAVLLVNHHPQLTQKFCDRLIFLDNGEVIIDNSIPTAFDELAEQGYDPFLPNIEWERIHD